MKKFLALTVALLALVAMFASQATTLRAGPTADCESFSTDDPSSTPVTLNFTCAADNTVYFGICDSGPFLDDFFNIEYNGDVVASNAISGSNEIVNIGSASVSAGAQSATLIRTAGGGTATYSVGISSDRIAVENYLAANCGGDFVPTTGSQGCNGAVTLFTEDGAPSDGTLEFHSLFGNEGARSDELIMMVWDISEGQQINNAMVSNLAAPRYARVWWQPDGSSDWYLLPSQYWHGGGTTADQYGIACGSGQPSYHTSFSSAVPEADVCFDLLNGC